MDRRRAAGALLALAACIACSDAAPTANNQTALDLYDGDASGGCYYNFQHYGEGDRIMTNEPCLNCTCHNRMLMCYLRVCPFTKPIGQDCTVEKRADQCCPIVTCPDVPVDLLTSTSTTSPAEYGSTGVGRLDKYGCTLNGKFLPEGSKVPPAPNKPCEHCYCIRNMTTCVMQECTLHVDGCTPIYHKDVCCPVRYSCDHPEDEILQLDDMTTTVRPTPGFLLTTTTMPSVTQIPQDCVHDDKIFPDGALIKTEKACEHCYCMKGDIVCVVQECGTPMENEGKNCTSMPPREGQCCPDTYICEGDNELPTDEMTTLVPPRRVNIEGSGYRKEPGEQPYTEIPTFEPENEGSGEKEQTEEPFETIAKTEQPKLSETPEQVIDTETSKTPESYNTATESLEDLTKPSIVTNENSILTTLPYELSEIATTEQVTTSSDILDLPSKSSLSPELTSDITESSQVTERIPEQTSFNPTETIGLHEEHTMPSMTTDQVTYSEHPSESTEQSEQPIETSELPELATVLTERPNEVTFSNEVTENHAETSESPKQPTKTTHASESTSAPTESSEMSEIYTIPDEISIQTTETSKLAEQSTIPSETSETYQQVTSSDILEQKTEAVETTEHTTILIETPRQTTLPVESSEVAEQDTDKSETLPKQTTETIVKIDINGDTSEPSVFEAESSTPEPNKEGSSVSSITTEGEASEQATFEVTTQSESSDSPKLITDTEKEHEQSQTEKYQPTIMPSQETTFILGGEEPHDGKPVATEPTLLEEDAATTSRSDVTVNDFEVTSYKPQELEIVTDGSTLPPKQEISTSRIEEEPSTGVPLPSVPAEVDNTFEPKDITTESAPEPTTLKAIVTQGPETYTTTKSENDLTTIGKLDTMETTSINPIENEISEEIGPISSPGVIPGEGDCLVNGITYVNESTVPSTNKCQSNCRCFSSIVKCDPIICSQPPEDMINCQPVFDSTESCCPTYTCEHTRETIPPKPHSQMSGTESPVTSSEITCDGDKCDDNKEILPTTAPECSTGECTLETGKKDIIRNNVLPEVCLDGKCISPPSDCSGESCQPATKDSHTCIGTDCGTEATPPICNVGEDCKQNLSPEISVPVSVDCSGKDCEQIPQDSQTCTGSDCGTQATPQVCKAGEDCGQNISPEMVASIPSDCSGEDCKKVPHDSQTCTGSDCGSQATPQVCKTGEDCGENVLPDLAVSVPVICSGEGCIQDEHNCNGLDCGTQVTTETCVDGQNCGQTGSPETATAGPNECNGGSCETVPKIEQPCEGSDCESQKPSQDVPETCKNGDDCKQKPTPEIAVPTISDCSGDSCKETQQTCVGPECAVKTTQLCNGEDCVKKDTPESTVSPCEGEFCSNVQSGCDSDKCEQVPNEQPSDVTVKPELPQVECNDESCVKRKASELDNKFGSTCTGAHCQQIPSNETPEISSTVLPVEDEKATTTPEYAEIEKQTETPEKITNISIDSESQTKEPVTQLSESQTTEAIEPLVTESGHLPFTDALPTEKEGEVHTLLPEQATEEPKETEQDMITQKVETPESTPHVEVLEDDIKKEGEKLSPESITEHLDQDTKEQTEEPVSTTAVPDLIKSDDIEKQTTFESPTTESQKISTGALLSEQDFTDSPATELNAYEPEFTTKQTVPKEQDVTEMPVVDTEAHEITEKTDTDQDRTEITEATVTELQELTTKSQQPESNTGAPQTLVTKSQESATSALEGQEIQTEKPETLTTPYVDALPVVTEKQEEEKEKTESPVTESQDLEAEKDTHTEEPKVALDTQETNSESPLTTVQGNVITPSDQELHTNAPEPSSPEELELFTSSPAIVTQENDLTTKIPEKQETNTFATEPQEEVTNIPERIIPEVLDKTTSEPAELYTEVPLSPLPTEPNRRVESLAPVTETQEHTSEAAVPEEEIINTEKSVTESQIKDEEPPSIQKEDIQTELPATTSQESVTTNPIPEEQATKSQESITISQEPAVTEGLEKMTYKPEVFATESDARVTDVPITASESPVTESEQFDHEQPATAQEEIITKVPETATTVFEEKETQTVVPGSDTTQYLEIVTSTPQHKITDVPESHVMEVSSETPLSEQDHAITTSQEASPEQPDQHEQVPVLIGAEEPKLQIPEHGESQPESSDTSTPSQTEQPLSPTTESSIKISEDEEKATEYPQTRVTDLHETSTQKQEKPEFVTIPVAFGTEETSSKEPSPQEEMTELTKTPLREQPELTTLLPKEQEIRTELPEVPVIYQSETSTYSPVTSISEDHTVSVTDGQEINAPELSTPTPETSVTELTNSVTESPKLEPEPQAPVTEYHVPDDSEDQEETSVKNIPDEQTTETLPEHATVAIALGTESPTSLSPENVDVQQSPVTEIQNVHETTVPELKETITKLPEMQVTDTQDSSTLQPEQFTSKKPDEIEPEIEISSETPIARTTLQNTEQPSETYTQTTSKYETESPVSQVLEEHPQVTDEPKIVEETKIPSDDATNEPEMKTTEIPDYGQTQKESLEPHEITQIQVEVTTAKSENYQPETTPYLVELVEHPHGVSTDASVTQEDSATEMEPQESEQEPQKPDNLTTEKSIYDEKETEGLPEPVSHVPQELTTSRYIPKESEKTTILSEQEPTEAPIKPEPTAESIDDKFGEISPNVSTDANREGLPTTEPEYPANVAELTTAFIPESTEKSIYQTEGSTAASSSEKPLESVSPTEKVESEKSTSKPSETLPSTAKPTDVQLNDELPQPEEEGINFPPSGTSGYGQEPEPDYVEEDQAFGPGTCRYGGKVYVSAQQIPRDDPCDFCFCFRSDIICLQQSCPPPIHGCHEEPIQGFCCPRYECPVSMATTLNMTTTTTTTTTTLPPHFLPHAYQGQAQRRGCQIKGHTYKVGEVVRASSGPCLHCTCGGDGQMKCDPKVCTPEPMLRQMIAAAVSAKRRR